MPERAYNIVVTVDGIRLLPEKHCSADPSQCQYTVSAVLIIKVMLTLTAASSLSKPFHFFLLFYTGTWPSCSMSP